MPKIDLDALAELTVPTWLEAMEMRRQCGISVSEFGRRLEMIATLDDPTESLEAMEALGIAVWLTHQRAGTPIAYKDLMATLTLEDFLDAGDAALEASNGVAAAGRPVPPRKKPARKKAAGRAGHKPR